jgi:hypothetical protein
VPRHVGLRPKDEPAVWGSTFGDEKVNETLLRFDVHQLVEYVESTRSDDGGYCFYRLNESNAADTFYAVYALNALNRPVQEPELTADFLQQRQDSDGSFQSVYSADYVLRGLDLLGAAPLFDPDEFLHSQLKRTLAVTKKPYYERSNSFLQSLGRAVVILTFRHEEPSPAVNSVVVAAVREYKRSEGGFGVDHASVYSTYNAVQALSFSPSDCLAGVAKWIRRCEWKTGGFSQTPANTPNYLDEIHRGLSIMRAVNERPHYPQEITRFIGQLQNANGGFRRAADSGISSLESAYYALKALVQLSYWKR